MKQVLSKIVLCTSLYLFTGCASTDEMILDSKTRAPTTTVEVFKDGKRPPRWSKEIAELTFLGPREDELRAQRRFIERAKELGGNGVVFSIVEAGEKGGGSAYGFAVSTAWVFKGVVVVFENYGSTN